MRRGLTSGSDSTSRSAGALDVHAPSTATRSSALLVPRLIAIVLTFWAGSLWTVCVLVAPSLFTVIPERQLAGQLAARLFHVEALLGAVGGVLLLGAWAARQLPPSPHSRSPALAWLIVLTAAAPLISALGLGPLLDVARAADDEARFRMLHGSMMVLFAIACAGALAMVWSLGGVSLVDRGPGAHGRAAPRGSDARGRNAQAG